MTSRKAFVAPEVVFVILGLVFGLAFAFVTAPFQVPDEPYHFFRAYQIGEGGLIAKGLGGEIPQSMIATAKVFENIPFHPEFKVSSPMMNLSIEDVFSLFRVPLEAHKRLFVSFPSTAAYSPVPYMPQALAMVFGREFALSPLLLMYLARICNLMVWLILGYCAIRLAPIRKWLFFLLGLMPMSLFQAASLSPDAFTNGVSFLLIAYFCRVALEPSFKVGAYELCQMAVLTLLLVLSKHVYFFLVFLFLMIPRDKIAVRVGYWSSFGIILLLSAALMALWNSVVFGMFGGTPKEQILYILSHPLGYCGVICKTLTHYGKMYGEQLIGQLGWLDTDLPGFFRLSYLSMLLVATVISSGANEMAISLRQRIVIFLVIAATIGMVFTALYLYKGDTYADEIEGVQGRYFIPISPLFFMLFCAKGRYHFKRYSEHLSFVIPGYALASLTFTLFTIFDRYYFWRLL